MIRQPDHLTAQPKRRPGPPQQIKHLRVRRDEIEIESCLGAFEFKQSAEVRAGLEIGTDLADGRAGLEESERRIEEQMKGKEGGYLRRSQREQVSPPYKFFLTS